MPISAAEIKNLLDKDGDFAHEMRVGAAITEAHFECEHAGTYTDANTNKVRQFDFRCCFTKENAALFLAVECKNLNPDYPLVICGVQRERKESFQEFIVSGGPGTPWPAKTPTPNVLGGIGPFSLIKRRDDWKRTYYQQGEFVGKNVARIGPKNRGDSTPVIGDDKDVYEKWAQALASSVELVDRACNLARPSQITWSLILPVVVLSEGSLWRVLYNKDGSADLPEQVTECDYYVGQDLEDVGNSPLPHGFKFTHIHFFTLTGFKDFLSKVAIDTKFWDRLFDPGFLRFEFGDQG